MGGGGKGGGGGRWERGFNVEKGGHCPCQVWRVALICSVVGLVLSLLGPISRECGGLLRFLFSSRLASVVSVWLSFGHLVGAELGWVPSVPFPVWQSALCQFLFVSPACW